MIPQLKSNVQPKLNFDRSGLIVAMLFSAFFIFALHLHAKEPLTADDITDKVPLTSKDIVEIQPDPEDPEFHVVITKDRQRFRIPKDMELKKKGNVYFVETMDSYVFKRYAKVKSDIKTINERLDSIEKKVAELADAKKKETEKQPAV